MAADENKGKGTTGGGTTSSSTSGGAGSSSSTSGGTGASAAKGGQQISGEQIFTTTEENTAGGESFATTGAGKTGGSSTSGGMGASGGSATGGSGGTGSSAGGENQASLSDAVSDAVSGDTGKAKEMLNQAKETTGKFAGQALGQVQEKASTLVDTKTSDWAQGLTGIADSVRQFTENLRNSGGGQEAPVAQTVAKYGETVTNQIEQLADYLDRADLSKLSRDLESFARKNPAIFLGGAFAAGILAARFIKSSQQRASASSNRQLGSGSNRDSSTAIATGEPPPLGKTLPSLDSPASGASDTGGTKTTPTA